MNTTKRLDPFSHYVNEAAKAIYLDSEPYPAIDCKEDFQIGEPIVPV